MWRACTGNAAWQREEGIKIWWQLTNDGEESTGDGSSGNKCQDDKSENSLGALLATKGGEALQRTGARCDRHGCSR